MREGQRRGMKREGSANSLLHRAIISSSFVTCSLIGADADGIFVSYTPNAALRRRQRVLITPRRDGQRRLRRHPSRRNQCRAAISAGSFHSQLIASHSFASVLLRITHRRTP